jgi:hypothetical protein
MVFYLILLPPIDLRWRFDVSSNIITLKKTLPWWSMYGQQTHHSCTGFALDITIHVTKQPYLVLPKGPSAFFIEEA